MVPNLILEDVDIIIRYLSMTRSAFVRVHNDTTYIKLAKPGERSDHSIDDKEIGKPL